MGSPLTEKNGLLSRDLKEECPFFDLKNYNTENAVPCQWKRRDSPNFSWKFIGNERK
jgi:hypothetical protein